MSMFQQSMTNEGILTFWVVSYMSISPLMTLSIMSTQARAFSLAAGPA